MMKKALKTMCNFFAPRRHTTGLPGVKIVLPKSLPAAGFQLRLKDAVSESELPFMNSSDIEVVFGRSVGGKSSVTIRLDDFVTDEMLQDLREGMPLIVKVTQLYEVAAVEQV